MNASRTGSSETVYFEVYRSSPPPSRGRLPVHIRLNEPVLPTIWCPLCTESNLIVACMRNDAKGNRRAGRRKKVNRVRSISAASQPIQAFV